MGKFKKSRKAFKKLRKKYKVIIGHLKLDTNSKKFCGKTYMKKATGFGSVDKCSLCIAANICDKCLYSKRATNSPMYCLNNEYKNSYRKIHSAKTKKDLIEALIGRRKLMKELINEFK